MHVKDRMSKAAVCCRPDDTLATAARIMWEHDCGAVPVVDERGCLVGIVTDRDACMASYTRGLRLDEIPVHTTMSRKVWSCRPEDSLQSAELLLRSHQVRRLPVVDANNRVVGVLSSNDLIRGIATQSGPARAQGADHLVATLAALSAPRQLAAAAAAAPAPAVKASEPAAAPAVPLPRPTEPKPKAEVEVKAELRSTLPAEPRPAPAAPSAAKPAAGSGGGGKARKGKNRRS